MAKKIKPQIRMVPLLLKRQDWDSLSYKGPGSETAKKIGPSLPETRPQRSGSVQGPPLPERPHHQKQRSNSSENRSRRSDGWRWARKPAGGPGGAPAQGRGVDSNQLGSLVAPCKDLQEEKRREGGRLTPQVPSPCWCPIQRVWKSFGAGNAGEERSGEAETRGTHLLPPLGGRGDNSGPLLTALLC